MKLTELFKNTTVPWKWTVCNDNEVEAVFMVGDVKYEFSAYAYSSDDRHWLTEFSAVGSTDKFGITGSGNSATVMTTIVDITRTFLNTYPVSILSFSAKETSRSSLYARMVQRLIPTWEMTKDGSKFTLYHPNSSR